MKNKKLIGIVLILVGLNIVLLYLNMGLQNQVENISEESTSWGFEQVGTNTAHIAHLGVLKPDTSLSLMVFLTDKGCISCVENEVRNINEFHRKFRDRLQVYLLAKDTSYIDRFYTSFPVERINPEKAVFDQEFDFENPVALVADANGMVQAINVSEVGKPGKQNRFYERMASLFQSVK